MHDWPQRLQGAVTNLRWMPSHGLVHTIGKVLDSGGRPITANSLVDSLAKAAALPHRTSTTCNVANAAKLVQYQSAKLGVATHEANNHRVEIVLDSGAQARKVVRDSTPVRPKAKVARAVKPRDKVPCPSENAPAEAARQREKLEDRSRVMNWVSDRLLKPASGPTAQRPPSSSGRGVAQLCHTGLTWGIRSFRSKSAEG